MSFHVGQKVVCVDDRDYGHPHPCDPVNGAVYTIKRIGRFAGFYVVALAEVHTPAGFLDWYKAFRFRPLTEKKTDISIFTEMLNTTKQPQRQKVSHELCGND